MGTPEPNNNPTLNDNKGYKKEAIDNKTRALILSGFVYDGNTFSLSPAAQTKWIDIKNNSADLGLYPNDPIKITAQNIDEYPLVKSDVAAFFTVAHDKIKGHYDSGRDLKKQVTAAADQTALDSIIDNRT